MALTDRYVTVTGSDTYANSTNIATPMSLSTAVTSAVAGDRINIKAGTYSRAASDTLTNSGTITSPIIFRGYNTTIGDGNLGRTNVNGALITTNMPLLSYASTFKLTVLTFTIVESLNITAPNNLTNVLTLGADSVVKSCKILNTGTNASSLGLNLAGTATRAIAFDNDIEVTGATGSHALDANGVAQRVIANRIKGGAGIGANLGGTASVSFIGNVIYASTQQAVFGGATTGQSCIFGNTIVGGSAEGINIITGTTGLQCIIGNIITDNATYGTEFVSTSNGAFAAYNRYRDNTTANTHNAGDWQTATGYGEVTSGNGTSDYVSAGTNDYTLIATSPAIGTGWFKYEDIGALSPQRTTSTGSTRIPSIGG